MIGSNNVRPAMMINMPVDFHKKTKKFIKSKKSKKPISNSILTNVFTTCLKIKLDEVLNIPVNDLKALKKYRPDHDKKFNISKYCIKKFNFNFNTFKFKTKALEFAFMKLFCSNKLHIVLNKSTNSTITDFVDHNCENLKEKISRLMRMSKIL